MAIFTLIVDGQTEAFGAGRRSGERQQLAEVLRATAEALRNPHQFAGEIRDINLTPGVDALTIGSWVYTPIASGDE